jgi:hypothetical protein
MRALRDVPVRAVTYSVQGAYACVCCLSLQVAMVKNSLANGARYSMGMFTHVAAAHEGRASGVRGGARCLRRWREMPAQVARDACAGGARCLHRWREMPALVARDTACSKSWLREDMPLQSRILVHDAHSESSENRQQAAAAIIGTHACCRKCTDTRNRGPPGTCFRSLAASALVA